jgi:hypothetical protein
MMPRLSALALGMAFVCCSYGQVSFHTPYSVIQNPPQGGVSSPTLRDDQKEMFFESAGDVYRAFRSDPVVEFFDSARVAELSTINFVEENPFLSTDGLRIYFTRRQASTGVREIFSAARVDWNSPFGPAVSAGPNGAEPFKGTLGSLTGDEKKVYLEITLPVPPSSGTTLTQQSDIAFATRESVSSKFGPWTFLTGVNTLDYERDPFITRDDRTLVYDRIGPLSHLPGTIFFATRPSLEDPFPIGEGALGINDPAKSSEDPCFIYPGTRIYFRQSGALWAADRDLDATYSLPSVQGIPGRSVSYPILVTTTEKDAIQFDFRLFFDSFYLTWDDVSTSPSIGGEVVSAILEGPGRLAVTMQGDHPLAGSGNAEAVASIRFFIAADAPAGQQRTFQISGQPKVNQIPVERPPSGKVQFLSFPGYPATSLLRLH